MGGGDCGDPGMSALADQSCGTTCCFQKLKSGFLGGEMPLFLYIDCLN